MRPDLLLVDVLDSRGAAQADARSRRRALIAMGHSVKSLVLDASLNGAGPRAQAGFEYVASHAELMHVLQTTLVLAPRARVIVAGTVSTAQAIAATLPADNFSGWWPTAIEGGDPAWWRPRPQPARWWPAARMLASTGGRSVAPHLDIAEALDRTPIEPLGHARGRLPLWDGEYLLVPAAMPQRVGEALLRSFARIAGDQPGLDLVVLSAPEPRLIESARRLGLSVRVHFAGSATCEAEIAWYGSASAVILASSEPFAACSLMRALACGAPVMAVGEGERASALRDWLLRQQLATPAQCAPVSSTSLHAVLERGEALERAIARGRALGLERAGAPSRVPVLAAARGVEAA